MAGAVKTEWHQTESTLSIALPLSADIFASPPAPLGWQYRQPNLGIPCALLSQLPPSSLDCCWPPSPFPPSGWTGTLSRRTALSSLAAPLGKDSVFQQRLASAAVGSIDPTGQIPEPFAELVQPILDSAAKSLTTLPGYPAAWEETLRKSHRLNFTASGTAPSEAGPSTSLTLDVAPLVGLLTQQISDATKVPLEAPEQTLIDIGQPSQRQLVDQVSAYAPMGYALAAGSAIALLLGLVAARRRWTVLVGAGRRSAGAGGGLETGRGRSRPARLPEQPAGTRWRTSSKANSSPRPPTGSGSGSWQRSSPAPSSSWPVSFSALLPAPAAPCVPGSIEQ